LDTLSFVDGCGTGVEGLDGKVLAAELLESGAIAVPLFTGAFVACVAFDRAILLPAIKQDPKYNQQCDSHEDRRIKQRILEGGLRGRLLWGVSGHGSCSTGSRIRERPAGDGLREILCVLVLAEGCLWGHAVDGAARGFEQRPNVTTVFAIVNFD